MISLDDLEPGVRLGGIDPERTVEIVQVERPGRDAVTVTYRTSEGRTEATVLFRQDESRLTLESAADTWSLAADGAIFQFVAEATRISLAHLLDPFLALSASSIRPLPHQIEAVYGRLLPMQPLRFLLADDPGAGKTIMAGLFCRELMIRGDVERCLVVAPGSLVEQWQDELRDKFGLRFDLLTRDLVEAAVTGNPLAERNLLIARLDQLSRSQDLQDRLRATEWDLVIIDEAHKMSARQFGEEVKETQRYRLGRICGDVTRHLLLMTATPHSGKSQDFRLFMRLLDPDRFEGRAPVDADVKGLMRRYSKEGLLTFEGRRLFPERRAQSPRYELSPAEMNLYRRVTSYVNEQMSNADQLAATGDRRGRVVGFALTTLQRRLASSPAAIHESLSRRRRRLEKRLDEARRGATIGAEQLPDLGDDFDEDDLTDAERESLEDEVIDEASAAGSAQELEWEIDHLSELEAAAAEVRRAGRDAKWEQLRALLEGASEMVDQAGDLRKLIIFTEHKDTLEYLVDRLRTQLGRTEAVVAIHGGMHREARRDVQRAFTQDRDVVILVATDAAGEGLNLQRAHLMVNYDLPWNPNRIEQRFGRIHRIGQTEVCHLWNLVAAGTREGEVFGRLFAKLEQQRADLGDQVFDVLGQAFEDTSLRDLLVEAIRYGEDPARRLHLEEVVDATIGDRVRALITEPRLATETLSWERIAEIRDDLARAEARRLQPHYIERFLRGALAHLGGSITERESGRFEVTFVPYQVRQRPRVQPRYERITFEKSLVTVPGRPLADLCCPGHPLLDAVIDVLIAGNGGALANGTVLVADGEATAPRVIVMLRHAIKDGARDRDGVPHTVSERLAFVGIDADGSCSNEGYAPYLDCRPATADELARIPDLMAAPWARSNLAGRATAHAISALVPEHIAEVRARVEEQVATTEHAVTTRLEAAIGHWDRRANELKDQELAGKQPRLTSANARRRADELEGRLQRRLAELARQRQLAPQVPVVLGGALVVPAGLVAQPAVDGAPTDAATAEQRARVERAAIDAVLATERALGRACTEMPKNNPGYDIESRLDDGTLLFIEVKGRVAGATTVTVSSNEILLALNKDGHHVLALVEVAADATAVRYVRGPQRWARSPTFTEVSVNFDLGELLALSEAPT